MVEKFDIFDPIPPATDPLNNRDAQSYTLWLAHVAHPGQCMLLIDFLQHIEFRIALEEDRTIAKKGLELRDRFQDISGKNAHEGMHSMGTTVLEVLVVLALEMDDICYDPSEGERPDVFFWIMLANLGIHPIDFSDFDWTPDKVIYLHQRLDMWMDRVYSPDGNGCPFPITNPQDDMIKVPLWTQMQWFCNEEL